ncbi:MAG TPA: class I SAM-dependent methyltransferase [Verrucomicrobiota bacterium]|nr:class I SAM-dependent methyltransferase [Verrucomicrobiota bacterium]
MSPRAARLRLHLTPAAARAVRGGHPWVFADRVARANRPGAAGELAALYDPQDRFLALGLHDPASPIRVRVLHAGPPVTADDPWWRGRLRAAIARRDGWFDAETTGGRLIHGESDGWPGLVLDRYAGVLVLKLYTAAWFSRLGELTRWIGEECRPGRLVLRLSRNVQPAAAALGIADGQDLPGAAGGGRNEPAVFLERGLRLEADVVRGQKTGFFLDQRENRRLVGELAAGRDVLNAFSFSGGFSLHAARGGARRVADLDLSAHALEAARGNSALNRNLPAVAAAAHERVQADAFAWLATPGPQFDLVILDPPSLAKREAERAGALAAYRRLAGLGLARLRPGGILVAASCSAHVAADEFFDAVREALRAGRRRFEEIRTTGHPPDHPATFPEAHYLKCLYARIP